MNKLDKYKFSTKKGFNSTLLKLRYKEYSKYFKGNYCLELGCADGEGTLFLLKYFDKIVAVDGSGRLIGKVNQKIKKSAIIINSYFEKFKSEYKFDTIILGHVLEHVDKPIKILRLAKNFLKKDGILIVDVPNALSIHRQIGVLLKIIKSEYSLNRADISIGHKRVYDMAFLKKDIIKAGLKIIKTGGLFLKPLSNSQMQRFVKNRKLVEAFNEMGKKYPAIASEIYIICKK